MLPMWMNLLIRTYSMMILMQDTGVINSVLTALNLPNLHMINTQGAVVFGMVYNYIPYMILPLYNIMSKMDHNLIEAAEDLGGNKVTVFKNVILPLGMPGNYAAGSAITADSVPAVVEEASTTVGHYGLVGNKYSSQVKLALKVIASPLP